MSKIAKTIARQEEKIKEGQFYEAHQQLRVIASRYVKQENYEAAIEILDSGAQLLLKADQGGSGGDLCIFLLDVYKKAGIRVESSNKTRLLVLLRAFPSGEPTRKKFLNEMIKWSARNGDYPAGDPDMHHVAGTLYAQEGEAYEAEKHLVLGTKDSPEQMAKLEYEWYSEDETHTASLYAARAIIPYLLTGNLRGANKALLIFTSQLRQFSQNLGIEKISSIASETHVFPSLPLINFLSLLLLTVQRGAVDLYRQLRSHYSAHLDEVASWNKALDQIGEMYFGIKVPSQTNPLFDMMSSMFMGGHGGSVGNPNRHKVEAPPPAYLD